MLINVRIIIDEKYLSNNKAVINHEEYLKLDKNRKFTILIDCNSRNR